MDYNIVEKSIVETFIAESIDQISKSIYDELFSVVKGKFHQIEKSISEILGEELYSSLSTQPEYIAISNGVLRAEIGLINAETAIHNVILQIIDSIKVEIDKDKFPNVFSIKITGIPNDYSELYSLQNSSYSTDKGQIIEWLKWLLENGDGVIVIGYDFIPGPFGRTGEGHMIPGDGWSLPPQFVGYKGNNFITRAIEQASPYIEKRIIEVLNVL